MTLLKMIAPTACAVGLLTGAAALASAAPTRVLYDGDPATGSRIVVASARGEANDLAVSVRPEEFLSVRLVDQAAGIRADPLFCTQISPVEVACDGRGLTELVVRTGDMPDHYIATDRIGDGLIFSTIDTGSGPDDVLLASSPTSRKKTTDHRSGWHPAPATTASGSASSPPTSTT